jgi:nucleoredoxin
VLCIFSRKLKTKYDIKAIPKLIVIRDNGTVITEKGRKDIQDKGMICFRGWLQKANLSGPTKGNAILVKFELKLDTFSNSN